MAGKALCGMVVRINTETADTRHPSSVSETSEHHHKHTHKKNRRISAHCEEPLECAHRRRLTGIVVQLCSAHCTGCPYVSALRAVRMGNVLGLLWVSLTTGRIAVIVYELYSRQLAFHGSSICGIAGCFQLLSAKPFNQHL